MGFFSDLKEDLSQAVNELLPDENLEELVEDQEIAGEEGNEGEALEQESENVAEDAIDLEKMLENALEAVDEEMSLETLEAAQSVEAQEDPELLALMAELAELEAQEAAQNAEAASEEKVEEAVEEVVEAAEEVVEETAEEVVEETAEVIEEVVVTEEEEPVMVTEPEVTEYKYDGYTKGDMTVAEMIDARMASDEISTITSGMTINGDVVSEGSLDLVGTINGNIDILGKLNVTGFVNGNSKAAEIFADSAKINGEVVSEGAVKVGSSSVIIGNITATSAVIAGAVKGDIDVRGPVILDNSAIVMGNIKSKSVQINNGAVIEGMCSQCYADVNPTSFFDDYKPEAKKAKKN